jgi:hypothetical protein
MAGGRSGCISLLAFAFVIGAGCGRNQAPTLPVASASCTPPTQPSSFEPSPVGVVPCPTAGELATVDAEVSVAFEGDVGRGSLVCRSVDGSRDLTQVQKNVYSTLLFMKAVRFDAPLPWTSDSLYDWFRLNVQGVRIRTDTRYDFCCDPYGVINLLGSRLVESTIPSYLEIMIHEARHIDGGGHPCGTGDNRIADLGAFGVQYYLMMWIGTHDPTASEAERAYALNRAGWIRASSFCSECQ